MRNAQHQNTHPTLGEISLLAATLRRRRRADPWIEAVRSFQRTQGSMNSCTHRIFQLWVFTVSASVVQAVTK